MRPENVRSRDYNVEGHAREVFFRLIELYFLVYCTKFPNVIL